MTRSTGRGVLLRDGDGAHVVLAHGLEDSYESWRSLSRSLPPGVRVTALDLPWRAGSDYAWRVRPSGIQLEETLAGLDRPADVLVAHSFGAHATLEIMSAGRPAVPQVAVLICPLYWAPDFSASWSVFDRARVAFEQHIRDGLRARLGARGALLAPDLVDGMADRAVDRVGPLGLLTVFDRLVSSRELDLAEITTRVLVLAARGDPTLPARAARHLGAALPAAEMWVRDDFDHFCHVKLAAEVAERIVDFADLRPVAVGTDPRSPHP